MPSRAASFGQTSSGSTPHRPTAPADDRAGRRSRATSASLSPRDAGDHRLDRFLAELLRDLGAALGEQLGGVASCRDRRLRAAMDRALESRRASMVPSLSGHAGAAPFRMRAEPHRQAGRGHVRLGLADGEGAEMEDRGGQHRGGVAVADAFDEMVQRADAARGDHRHAHRVGDRAGQREVEAGSWCRRGPSRSAGSRRRRSSAMRRAQATASRPVGVAAAMGEDSHRPGADLLGVDRDDDALAAELLGRLAHELRARFTAAVLIETLSAPASSSLRMSSTVRTPPPTVSGMKHCSARAAHDVEQRVAVLVAGGDVEEAQLVGARARRRAAPARPDRRHRPGRRS